MLFEEMTEGLGYRCAEHYPFYRFKRTGDKFMAMNMLEGVWDEIIDIKYLIGLEMETTGAVK